jgi:Homeodomain-like domain
MPPAVQPVRGRFDVFGQYLPRPVKCQATLTRCPRPPIEGRIPRPLSSTERQRLERAQADVQRAERDARERVRKARAKRDREILRAVENGAAIADIARLLGLSRQAVYIALERARGHGAS